MDSACAGGALVFRALGALDAAVCAVFGLALLPGELYAVDAVVALVEHGEVIDHAAAEARAAGRIRADPVEVRRNELLVLGSRRAGCSGKRQSGNCEGGAFHR